MSFIDSKHAKCEASETFSRSSVSDSDKSQGKLANKNRAGSAIELLENAKFIVETISTPLRIENFLMSQQKLNELEPFSLCSKNDSL